MERVPPSPLPKERGDIGSRTACAPIVGLPLLGAARRRGIRSKLIAAMLAAGFAAPVLANDMSAVLAEMKRLAMRIEALEQQNKELEKALATDRLSEREPELVTRLKAAESQTLAMQGPLKKLNDALGDIKVTGSLTGVMQKVGAGDTASGTEESRASYRGDVTVTLPGGKMGDAEGKIFAHFRFGQGTGIGLRPTYTSTANTTAFQTNAGSDDSFAILAQGWYQMKIPLIEDGDFAQTRANAREAVYVTAGKIDPFVFFDQNAAADDESAKFLNNVFVHNPLLDSGGDIRADRYGFAPGAIVKYENTRQKGGEWALSLGVFGSGPGANFAGSQSRPLFIAQAETAMRINYLPGTYRVYLWRQGRASNYDQVERLHAGLGASVDQKVGDHLTAFGRYGHQLKGKSRFDRALTLGMELDGSGWSRAADGVGIAFGALRTGKDFRNDSATIDANGDGTPDFGYQASGAEKQLELYYRYKLNGTVALTPDFQMIRQPGGNAAAPTVKVLGLRAKLGF